MCVGVGGGLAWNRLLELKKVWFLEFNLDNRLKNIYFHLSKMRRSFINYRPDFNNQEEGSKKVSTRENLIFDKYPSKIMAEEMFMYAVTAGIFAFLVAILFGTRGARKRKEPEERAVETTESSYSGSSGSEGGGGGGKRIKRFKSDGTPVYE
jgi:hypothetical protein